MNVPSINPARKLGQACLLRQQLAQLRNHATSHPGDSPSLSNPPSAISGPKIIPDDSAHVIKHMGRLVHDPVGVGRFAGSTTGVHFALSVEATCRQVLYLAESFPECCYSLYLAGPARGSIKPTGPTFSTAGDLISSSPNHEIIELISRPPEFYTDQIDRFFSRWEAFCPVLARKQLVDTVYNMVKGMQESATAVDADESTLCILLTILSINYVSRSVHTPLNPDMRMVGRSISIADALQSRLVARGDIRSLQGLVLLSFYYQLTGHSLALIRLNGSMMRIAQSLGLHRHARRFRMTAGEIELRKRLWWWVYTFDRVTAIVHGLPPLISDADVDNELPTDCQLDDFTAVDLRHPFPGQTTPVSFFNHYAVLGRKMSSILHLLYTTTQRRHGVAKIERLDRDIRVWNQNLGLDEEALDTDSSHSPATGNGCGSMILWLRLLSRFCIILIHRPGLTFDDSTKEFASCLAACIRASTEIIHLLWLPDLEPTFLSFCPFGPGLVFQCALMHVYCQCKSRIINLADTPTIQESTCIISNAINILARYGPHPQTAPSEDIAPEDRQIQSIDSAITLLKDLTLALQHANSQAMSWETEPPVSPTPYALPMSSLYDLNYMTAMDWAQDISDTFGNLPDLGG
ncbi:fungal-specific transcription factor domain-containing protein [Aspergillus pseudoustus]|uniref:Fungal-specific transcription factor domain-containing protein n=1 Tax=Aspergillus pseudoustus TaxID=1810923 RepID=A0ABR4JRB0_9EURO